MATYLDAAYHILHHAGQPLRYEEITGRARESMAGAAVLHRCPCKFQGPLTPHASLQGDQHLQAELLPLAAHQI